MDTQPLPFLFKIHRRLQSSWWPRCPLCPETGPERQDRPGLRADSSWDHWHPAVSSLPHARFLSSVLQIGAQDICAHGQDEMAIRASELIMQTGNSQRTSNPHLSTRGGLFPSSVAFKLLPRVNSQNCQELWGPGPAVHLITLYLRVACVACGSGSL